MQSERLGSTLKSLARHSATHAVCVESQPAAEIQAAQLLAVCALTAQGDAHATNNKTRTAGLSSANLSISAPT